MSYKEMRIEAQVTGNKYSQVKIGVSMVIGPLEIWMKYHISNFQAQDSVVKLPLDFTDINSILVLEMVWCPLATHHYINQYWPRTQELYIASLDHNELKCLVVTNDVYININFHKHTITHSFRH